MIYRNLNTHVFILPMIIQLTLYYSYPNFINNADTIA